MQNKINTGFNIYLVGQGVSNLGDSIRFIAVTMLIFRFTGSGMTAAFGIMLSSLPSIIALPFAGVLGDRTNEKKVLILVDLVRFMTVPLFLYADKIGHIYLLLVLLSLFDVFYGPCRRKFIRNITGKKGALKANSYLAGASGLAYFIGPLTSGFLTDRFGPAPAILIASLCCIISCFLTLLSGIAPGKAGKSDSAFVPSLNSYVYRSNVAAELKEGLRYCFLTPPVRMLLMIGFIMGFGTISVNMAFYPYAFDVLRVTAKGWSLMITLYYGTSLIAVLLVKRLERFIKDTDGKILFAGLMIVPAIWILYAFTARFTAVLVLQFIEGSVISMCGIILSARFQVITDRELMARVSGTNDIFANTGKLAGMGCAAILTKSFSFYSVFIFNGVLLFLFAVYGQISSGRSRKLGLADVYSMRLQHKNHQ